MNQDKPLPHRAQEAMGRAPSLQAITAGPRTKINIDIANDIGYTHIHFIPSDQATSTKPKQNIVKCFPGSLTTLAILASYPPSKNLKTSFAPSSPCPYSSLPLPAPFSRNMRYLNYLGRYLIKLEGDEKPTIEMRKRMS